MTNLSDAAEILKRARAQQQAEAATKPKIAKPKYEKVVTSMSVNPSPPVYTLRASSGRVVKMMEDDEHERKAGKSKVVKE